MAADTPPTEPELHAYADGRLAPGPRAEVEAWLEAHPEDAERVAAYRRMAEELHALYDPVLAEPVPQRLQAVLDRPRRRWASTAKAASWMLVGAALGALGGWQIHGSQPALQKADAGAAMARRAAVAHATYSPEVRHPVEVGADQEAHLVAWLSKRLGAPLKAPRLEAVGYSLVGGRLLPGDNGPVAQFMYQCAQGTRVTLYVRTERSSHRETAFRFAKEGNVSVFYWVDHKLGYALSSGDISKGDLLKVSNTVYRQLNP